jgi:hypothetical protein
VDLRMENKGQRTGDRLQKTEERDKGEPRTEDRRQENTEDKKKPLNLNIEATYRSETVAIPSKKSIETKYIF